MITTPRIIGIDCRLYSPQHTGIGRYVYELVQELMEVDVTNSYVLYFNDPEYQLFQPKNARFQKKLVNIPHYSLDEQTRWLYFLNHEPVDLMHFPHFNVPLFYTRPFVVTIHDLTLHYFPYKSYFPQPSILKQLQVFAYRFLMGRVVRNARAIIAVSENTKRDLAQAYSVPDQKITRIYEGVPEHFQPPDEGMIRQAQSKYQISSAYFLYTGVWRSHKNLLRLFSAFQKFSETHPEVKLVLAGKKDERYPEIFQALRDLQLTEKVIMTGFVSDEELMALTSGALAFVFPSLYEGFGLPPLEAMKLGTPVLAARSSSLPEVCGDAALYFDPLRVEDMADAMSKIAENQQLRDELRGKGIANVQRFSWKSMARDILDIYTKLH